MKTHYRKEITLESLRKLFRAFTIENDSCGDASRAAIACA